MQYGYTYRHITKLANCSIGTVTNILQCHHLYGQSTNPFGQRPGRTPFLDAGDLTYLNHLLEREPWLYLDELQERLEDARNIHISLATLHRALERLDISRKCVSKAAAEQISIFVQYGREKWHSMKILTCSSF
jgi:transposase